jgi:hypothetical protein
VSGEASVVVHGPVFGRADGYAEVKVDIRDGFLRLSVCGEAWDYKPDEDGDPEPTNAIGFGIGESIDAATLRTFAQEILALLPAEVHS